MRVGFGNETINWYGACLQQGTELHISKRLLLKATGLAPHILVEESCLEVSLYMHVTFDRSLAVRTRRVWLYGKTE